AAVQIVRMRPYLSRLFETNGTFSDSSAVYLSLFLGSNLKGFFGACGFEPKRSCTKAYPERNSVSQAAGSHSGGAGCLGWERTSQRENSCQKVSFRANCICRAVVTVSVI